MLAEENKRGRLAWSAGILIKQIEKKTTAFCLLQVNSMQILSVHLSVCLFVCLSVCPVCLVCLSVCLSVPSVLGSFCLQSRKISFSPFKHPEPTFVKLNLILSSPVLDTPWYEWSRDNNRFDLNISTVHVSRTAAMYECPGRWILMIVSLYNDNLVENGPT